MHAPSLTIPNFGRSKGANFAPPPLVMTATTPLQKAPVEFMPPPITIPLQPVPPLQKRTPAIAIVDNKVPYQRLTLTIPTDSNPGTPVLALTIPNIGTPKNTPGSSSYTGTPRIGGGLVSNSETRQIYIPQNILKHGEDPWLPPKIDGPNDIRIIAITPIGTISLVETADKRPPTPRRRLPTTPGKHLTLNVINEKTGLPIVDPLLTATIYLDCTKPEDQDYHHVANKMHTLNANMSTFQKRYITELKPIPALAGKVSPIQFEEALLIYENNQVYYQDRIDDKSIDMNTIRTRLTELEHWFICIIEPRALDDINSWRERELSKFSRGISSHCDPELHKYIRPIDSQQQQFIRNYHIGIL